MEKLKYSFPTSCKQRYPQLHKQPVIHTAHNACYGGIPSFLSIIYKNIPYSSMFSLLCLRTAYKVLYINKVRLSQSLPYTLNQAYPLFTVKFPHQLHCLVIGTVKLVLYLINRKIYVYPPISVQPAIFSAAAPYGQPLSHRVTLPRLTVHQTVFP